MLLSISDGPPFEVINEWGASEILLVCEHASNRTPSALGSLGLANGILDSHVAWDIGAENLARSLSSLLDASLILARFSRLVCDCNRNLCAPDIIVEETIEGVIPGNRDLAPEAKAARIEEIHRPFHDGISEIFNRRLATGRSCALVTVHSFTPHFHGRERPVQIGVVHDQEDKMAREVMTRLFDADRFTVVLNEPYSEADGVTYTLERHARDLAIPSVMLEVRNDVLSGGDATAAIAELLASALAGAAVASRTSSTGSCGASNSLDSLEACMADAGVS